MRKTFTASVYIVHEQHVLLIHHNRFHTWVPVGGELKDGEDPLTGGRREVGEETGIVDLTFPPSPLSNCNVAGLMGYEEHDAGAKGWHMNFAFLAFAKSKLVPAPCDEFSSYRWFTTMEPELESAPLNVRHFARQAVLYGR